MALACVGKRAGLALGGPGLAASPSLGGGRGRGGPAGNVPKKARGKEVRLLCRKGRGGRRGGGAPPARRLRPGRRAQGIWRRRRYKGGEEGRGEEEEDRTGSRRGQKWFAILFLKS